jgi:fumarylacetoacetate (FAA) hydrolase
MKLATLPNATLDGTLVLVSADLSQACDASDLAPNLITALQQWDQVSDRLHQRYEELNAGQARAFPFNPSQCLAPLPRSPQWLDGSAFRNHGELMEKAFKLPPPPMVDTVPMMYQGASDDFLGPHADSSMPSEGDGIDFEGEFGVIVGPVSMSIQPAEALRCIRLLVQINDWSLRALGPHEMKTGFGFLQAKPSTAFAPVAVTSDELGDAWKGGRIHLNLRCELNGQRFGEANGREMDFHFGDLIAHAARTRKLTAGCIIGSGTVSNVSRSAGSSCIAERRVIETLDLGEAQTPYMRFGDRIRMQAQYPDGRPGPFGVIDQRVVHAREA